MLRWLQAIRARRTMRQFRESMAFFGVPVDDMTDDELLAGATEITQAAAGTGVTATEANDMMLAFARPVFRAPIESAPAQWEWYEVSHTPPSLLELEAVISRIGEQIGFLGAMVA